jgi:predicted porin
MNKKLMAVAIAAALSPLAALADPSGVTLYGNMNVSAERVTGLGGAGGSARETRLTDSSSRIGVRGAEKLGASGLEGFFQVETLVAPEGNNSSAPLGWASRNSGVGLRGAFGEVLGGRWDTYYNDTFGVDGSLMGRGPLSAFATSIIGQTGLEGVAIGATPAAAQTAALNAVAATLAPGDRPALSAALAGVGAIPIGGRYANVIRYATPNLAGFQAIGIVGASENGQDGTRGKKTALNLRYGNGPFLGTASILNEGNNPGSTFKNKGVKFGAAFTAPSATKFGVIYEQLTWPTNTTELKRKNLVGTISQNLGAVDLNLTYAKAKEAQLAGADLAGTGAKFLTLTGAYSFSKRTLAYLSYNKIDNDSRAAYDFFAGGGARNTLGATAVPLGTDPKTIHLGVNHSF